LYYTVPLDCQGGES